MKVKSGIIILMIILAVVVCGSTRTVVDVTDTSVTIFAVPKRIVALVPSDAEMLFDLGVGERVVGVNDWTEYPKETEEIAKIGGSPLNIEKILALAPDLVVGNYGLAPQEITRLRELGVTVFAINPTNLKEVSETYLLLGRALGVEDYAENLVKGLEDRLDSLSALDYRPKVFVEIWSDPLMTAGTGSLWDDVIKAAGGQNIGSSAAGEYPIYSEEDLIRQNPDLIILTNFNLEEALQKPVYTTFKEKLLQIDPAFYSYPAARLWDGVEKLYETFIKLQ